jgi:class 3 adenylate cyclase
MTAHTLDRGAAREGKPNALSFHSVEASTARLLLIRARNVSLRADRSQDELYRTRFEGRAPQLRAEDATVTLEYPRFAVGRRRPYRSTVTMNGSMPWRIECRGMLWNLRVDFSAGILQAFDVRAGASGIGCILPSPTGEVPIQLSGGVADASFLRPVGVPVRVRVAGGAAGLALDEQFFKAVGGEVTWQTPDFDDVRDRYDILMMRGAKGLTVGTVEPAGHMPTRAGRTLATVVFTDIVGSTERARDAGDLRWRELLDRHDATAARLVREEGGELVKTTGDGILALFDRPGHAIGFARAFREAVQGWELEIRAGLHAGEVEHRGSDVGGIGVHIASRIMDAARPGEIVVSRTVRDLVAGSDVDLEDRGMHSLRGVGDDWQLFAVR